MKGPPDDDLKVSQPPWSSANAAPIYPEKISVSLMAQPLSPKPLPAGTNYPSSLALEGVTNDKDIYLGLRANSRAPGRTPDPLDTQACTLLWCPRPRHMLPVHDAELIRLRSLSGVHHAEPALSDGARCEILRCGITLIDPSHSGPSRCSLSNRSPSECHPSQCWLTQGGLSRCRLLRCGPSHQCLSHYGLSDR